MFLLPPRGGLSFAFLDLINIIDFEGNIYVIDDYKYDLTLEEIKKITDNDLTFNYYYDAIKKVFRDGDIIVGYSLGCIYALLLAEKLEKDKSIDKCILIDGFLNFVQNEKPQLEEVKNEIISEDKNIFEKYSKDFIDKIIEIMIINSTVNFHTPHINSHIIYLGTSDKFKEELSNISDNYDFILINSTHSDIIGKDVHKIAKYFR